MKTRTPTTAGIPQVIIVTSNLRTPAQRFHKFPRKAGTWRDSYPDETASHKFVATSSWELASGKIFFYVDPSFYTWDEVNELLLPVSNFVVPDYPGWWQGEAYNALLRSIQTLKFDEAGYEAYKLAN